MLPPPDRSPLIGRRASKSARSEWALINSPDGCNTAPTYEPPSSGDYTATMDLIYNLREAALALGSLLPQRKPDGIRAEHILHSSPRSTLPLPPDSVCVVYWRSLWIRGPNAVGL